MHYFYYNLRCVQTALNKVLNNSGLIDQTTSLNHKYKIPWLTMHLLSQSDSDSKNKNKGNHVLMYFWL